MEDDNHGDQSHQSVAARRALAGTAHGTAEVEMEGQRENKAMEQLIRDAALLRATRVPGKGKLSVDEAIAALIEQANTFVWWIDSGLPLGEIRAWVEGREVMGVLPKLPAKLKTFTFDIPSRESDVLQLTTRAGDRLIVLFTLLLRDVPTAGLERTLLWRNGQGLLLKIAREANGELSVEVIINPHRVGVSTDNDRPKVKKAAANATVEVEPTQEETPKAKAVGMKSTLVERGREFLTGFFRPSARNLGYVAASLACVLVLIPLNNLRLGGGELVTSSPPKSLAENSGTALPDAAVPQTATVENPSDGISASAPEPVGTNLPPAATPPTKKSAVKSVERRKPVTTRGVVAIPDDAMATDGRTIKALYGHLNQTERPGEIDASGQSPAAVLSAGAEKYAKLATMRSLYIKLDRTRPNLSTDLDKLQEAMARALKASERFMVLVETDQRRADAVISLRFWEPDENRQGAIYANVRDLSGKLLWDDLVSCSDLLDGSQNVALDDASVRLVNKLKEVVGLAQQSSKLSD